MRNGQKQSKGKWEIWAILMFFLMRNNRKQKLCEHASSCNIGQICPEPNRWVPLSFRRGKRFLGEKTWKDASPVRDVRQGLSWRENAPEERTLFVAAKKTRTILKSLGYQRYRQERCLRGRQWKTKQRQQRRNDWRLQRYVSRRNLVSVFRLCLCLKINLILDSEPIDEQFTAYENWLNT